MMIQTCYSTKNVCDLVSLESQNTKDETLKAHFG